MSWTKKVVVLCGVGIVVVCTAGYALHARLTHNPLAGVQKQYSFPLFYPKKLPNHWKIKKDTISGNKQVLLYRIEDSEHKEMAVSVTIQARPEDFSFDNFYKIGLANSTQFTTTLGQAAIGDGPHNYKIGSLATEQTWILISSVSVKVSQSQIRTLLSSLTQI